MRVSSARIFEFLRFKYFTILFSLQRLSVRLRPLLKSFEPRFFHHQVVWHLKSSVHLIFSLPLFLRIICILILILMHLLRIKINTVLSLCLALGAAYFHCNVPIWFTGLFSYVTVLFFPYPVTWLNIIFSIFINRYCYFRTNV